MNPKYILEARTACLINLRDCGKLWSQQPLNEHDKVALTDMGRGVVSRIVAVCLFLGETPNCAVNGDNLTADAEINSLSMAEFADLQDKAKKILG